MARSGELMIDVTTQLDLYGGALSSVGAQVRNAGDSLAQAAASMRFKTGSELVTDELRECGTCLQEAAQKCRLAVAEAQQDGSHDLVSILGASLLLFVNKTADVVCLTHFSLFSPLYLFTVIAERMQDPFSMGGQALESAGAGILQRIPVSDVGTSLTDAAVQIKVIARLLPQLAPNESDAALAGQRLDYCAQQMTRAGQELQGVVPDKPKGKSWLKGGS